MLSVVRVDTTILTMLLTGTTDISKIYESSNHGQYYWQDQTIQQNFLSRSAMYHVANATAPTLLFHGQRDPRMPISQAFQLHYALRAQQVRSRVAEWMSAEC